MRIQHDPATSSTSGDKYNNPPSSQGGEDNSQPNAVAEARPSSDRPANSASARSGRSASNVSGGSAVAETPTPPNAVGDSQSRSDSGGASDDSSSSNIPRGSHQAPESSSATGTALSENSTSEDTTTAAPAATAPGVPDTSKDQVGVETAIPGDSLSDRPRRFGRNDVLRLLATDVIGPSGTPDMIVDILRNSGTPGTRFALAFSIYFAPAISDMRGEIVKLLSSTIELPMNLDPTKPFTDIRRARLDSTGLEGFRSILNNFGRVMQVKRVSKMLNDLTNPATLSSFNNDMARRSVGTYWRDSRIRISSQDYRELLFGMFLFGTDVLLHPTSIGDDVWDAVIDQAPTAMQSVAGIVAPNNIIVRVHLEGILARYMPALPFISF